MSLERRVLELEAALRDAVNQLRSIANRHLAAVAIVHLEQVLTASPATNSASDTEMVFTPAERLDLGSNEIERRLRVQLAATREQCRQLELDLKRENARADVRITKLENALREVLPEFKKSTDETLKRTVDLARCVNRVNNAERRIIRLTKALSECKKAVDHTHANVDEVSRAVDWRHVEKIVDAALADGE